MRGNPSDFWGKLSGAEDERTWHPLIDHCADVGATCEALLQRTLLRKRLATLGGLNDLNEIDVQRLAALATFHDVGKFNHGFQNKANPSENSLNAGHVQPPVALIADSGSSLHRQLVSSLPLEEVESWAVDATGIELLVSAIAHHGRPADSGPIDVQLWKPDEHNRNPFEGMARLSTKVHEWFPRAFEQTVRPLPAAPKFQHGFCGLVTLADWIGSDRSKFRFTETGDPDRMKLARRWAGQILASIGLDPGNARGTYNTIPHEFAQIFGFSPNPVQRRMTELSDDESKLFILESETGSGKTEAAMARFFRLFAAGAVDGMYFALPTRTSAVQMHRRIAHNVEQAFADIETRPPVILAVPGYVPLDDRANASLMAPFETLYPDRDAQRYRGWASEHSKRYLAGAISVGTIDQALLSALMVSHSHLRATSLLRQFLVVDEVHASDAYMSTILREVLRFHLAAGGHAMLLSATLGSRAAITLSTPLASIAPKPPSQPEAERLPYPSLMSSNGREKDLKREFLESASSPKAVAVEMAGIADDPFVVCSRAVDAVLAGGRVLIVRNTVRDCVATQLALEQVAAACGVAHALFTVNELAAPHHARYARSDRVLLDSELERRFGKTSTGSCVAVATQTVQQSLDLDADLMLTDLCPIDVMLQRVGRLHRHRRDRPERLRTTKLIALTPTQRDLTPRIRSDGTARGEHGFGTVYEDLRMLEAVWRILERTPTLHIPSMNRPLVEAGTHPEALNKIVAELGEEWRKHALRLDGQTLAARGLAALNCVDRSEPFPQIRFPSSLDIRVRTRLGESDRIVEFATPIASPFGSSFDRLTLPGWFAYEAPVEAEPTDIVSTSGVLRFTFAGRRFIYDRLGLRPDQSSSDNGEDLADG